MTFSSFGTKIFLVLALSESMSVLTLAAAERGFSAPPTLSLPHSPASPHGKEKEGKEKRGGWIKPQKQGDRWGKSRLQSTVRGFAEGFTFVYFWTTTDDFGQAIRVISTARQVHW